MAKDPAFLFYPNDYIGGTMGMTFEEKGAYIELLMMQFNRGHMTSHMIGQTVGQLWDKIKDKFIQDEEGLWYNQRLEKEKIARQKYTESRRNNISGVNQYNKKKTKDTAHMGGHMTSHMEDVIVNEDVIEGKGGEGGKHDFDVFWNAYDKKIGDKSKLSKKWNALGLDTQDAILAYLPKYKAATPDKSYRKNPETFLNNKSWNDEIITKKPIHDDVSADKFKGITAENFWNV